jgi:uncharacterized RDD family membrane protein YckC
MKYIIKDVQGNEHGPVDEETLAKWVDEDRVTAETPVRSQLLKGWKCAEDVPFLKERLAEQTERRKQVDSGVKKSLSAIKGVKGKLFTKKESGTAFVHQHIPKNAGALHRFYAFLYDLVIIALVGGLIGAGSLWYAYNYAGSHTDSSVAELAEKDMMLPKKAEKIMQAVGLNEKKAPKKTDEEKQAELDVKKNRPIYDNLNAQTAPYTKADAHGGYGRGSLWINKTDGSRYVCLGAQPGKARWINVSLISEFLTWFSIGMLLLIVLYYGISLGYFAQTFGMWFWGIFITKKDISEVYYFRAFLFTVFMLLFGILSPLFVYVFRRGLHDILTGVRIIGVAGTSRV